MGMFKLVKNAADCSLLISLFRRRHLHCLDAPVVGPTPLRYPCLVSPVKAFTESAYNVAEADRTRGLYHNINVAVKNEICYRSQAKKLVYPLGRELANPWSRKICNIDELIHFVGRLDGLSRDITRSGRYREWSSADIDRYNGFKKELQLRQINGVYDRMRAHTACEGLVDGDPAFPCIISFQTINVDAFNNSVVSILMFFILTKKEARSLVYHDKNMGLKVPERASTFTLEHDPINFPSSSLRNDDNIPF